MNAGHLVCVIRTLRRGAWADAGPLATVACALAVGSSACTEPEPVPLPPSTTLIGKCEFSEQANSQLEAGEVFLYALRDDHDGALGVVTGITATPDSLLDVVERQPATTILPARLRQLDRLEFGRLAADRTGDAEHFVAMSGQPGMVFTSVGTTYATQLAYPTCVFWE